MKCRHRSVRRVVGKWAVFGGLLAVTVACGYLSRTGIASGGFWDVLLSVPFSISCLALIGWFLYCVHRISLKWEWRVFGFALLFCWSFLTFLTDPTPETVSGASGYGERVLNVASRTATVLFTKRSAVENGYSHARKINHAVLQISIAMYLGTFLFSFLGRRVVNRFRVRLTLGRQRNVFWGIDDRELMLARSIVSESDGESIQFNISAERTYEAAKARLTDLADDMDACWTFVDFEKPGRRCHAGQRHFFLNGDGRRNLAIAKHVVAAYIGDETANDEKVLYVRAGDIDSPEVFSAWAESVYNETCHLIRPVILHEPDLMARQFVCEHPPLSSPSSAKVVDTLDGSVTGPFCRTLLLGFDHTGRALLNALLCCSRFAGKKDGETVVCPITVVDRDVRRKERFCLQEPEIGEHCEEYGLSFETFDVGGIGFENWLKPKLGEFDRYIFCLPDDASNIREALRIRDLLMESGDGWRARNGLLKKSIEIFVRTTDATMGNVVDSVPSDPFRIGSFGVLENIYCRNFLNDSPVEKLAQALNWQWSVNRDDYLDEHQSARIYLRKRSRPQLRELEDNMHRCWDRASYYDRLSSIASALGLLSFLRLVGIRFRLPNEHLPEKVRNFDLNVSRDFKALKMRIDGALDNLSRTEHLRWWAYLATMGVRVWDFKQPVSLKDVLAKSKPGIVPNSLAKQVDSFRAHAAMVGFDELPMCDAYLAQACGCQELMEEDFVGAKQPDVGGGRHPSSLQGKDYDMWRIVPGALALSGVDLYDAAATKDVLRQVGRSGVWRRLNESMTRLRNVFRRKSAASERIESYGGDLSKLLEWARWVDAEYDDNTAIPRGAKQIDFDFMNAGIVEHREQIKGTAYWMFWFDDAISLKRKFFWDRTRIPYVWNPQNGTILPFYRLPRDCRRSVWKGLGMKGRRALFQRSIFDKILFHRQPDFSVQVFLENGVIVIIFRGTNTLTDWYENVIQFFGSTPPQFRLAADFVRAICETTERNILLLGHSEGGGEVQYALMRNAAERWTRSRKINGVTFNAQRLSARLFADLKCGFDDKYPCEHIINFRMGRDIVSGWGPLGRSLLGRTYTLSENRSGWCVRSHFCEAIVRELKRITRASSIT